MYELSRVRLYSVGPVGARYEDVLLNLSGAGEPVREQQLMLGAPELRRPSPATILFLENGGGKSVLIKLIFSVMLPGRRQVVGSTNSKLLENFVARNDVSHVVLEWMHSRTGRLLLTGKVSDWRSGADTDTLAELWYSLRPHGSLEITTLPFAEDGHNLDAVAYRRRLENLDAEDPHLELDSYKVHKEWSDRLASLGLDTELFSYQRAMNAGEGAAADAFTFASDDAFVEFLLRAVLPQQESRDIAESIAEHASKLGQREELELERVFLSETLERLDPLAHQHILTVSAAAAAARASTHVEAFLAQVAARADQEKLLHNQHAAAIEHLVDQVAASEHASFGAQARHGALVHAAASMRLHQAITDEKALRARAQRAELKVRGWEAIPALIRLGSTVEKATALATVVAAQQNRAHTAMNARDDAGAALARALLVILQAATADAEREQRDADTCKRQMLEQRRLWETAVEEAATEDAHATSLSNLIAEVDAELETAQTDGLIESRTGLDAAAVAAGRCVEEHSGAVEASQARLTDLETEIDQAGAQLLVASTELTVTKGRLDTAQRAVQRAHDSAGQLEALPRLAELLDSDTVVLDLDAETLLEQLLNALDHSDRARTAIKIADAADEPARIAWGEDPEALLTAPHELRALCQQLEQAQILCWTGWDLLAVRPNETVRREIVGRLPHLAGGLILNDLADLDRAREILTESPIRPNGVVFVASTQSFDRTVAAHLDLGIDAETGFVVPPNPALYDPTAAAGERVRLLAEHALRLGELSGLDACYHADSELHARITAWRNDYPPGKILELDQAVKSAMSAVSVASIAVEAATTAQQQLRATAERLREDLHRARGDLDDLRERARVLKHLAGRAERVLTWQRQRQRHLDTAATRRRKAAELAVDIEKLDLACTAHSASAVEHRALAERTKADITEIPAHTQAHVGDPVPDQPVAVLRARLHHTQRALDKAQVGDDQLKELDAARRQAEEAQQDWEDLANDVRETATGLLDSGAGADAASRSTATTRARTELATVTDELGAAQKHTGFCESDLKRLPAPHPPLEPSRYPISLEHAHQLIDTAAAQVTIAVQAHDTKIAELAAVRREYEEARAVAAAFESIVEMAYAGKDRPVIDPDSVQPYPADVEQARSRYHELRGHEQTAHQTSANEVAALGRLADRLARFVAQPRFESLDSAVRVQIRSVAQAQLPAHAADWIEQLTPRVKSLAQDLEHANRHRAMILGNLRSIVDVSVRTLRAAQRLSKLPDTLESWAGHEFLRIGFTPAEGELLEYHLGQVLDDEVQRYLGNGKRDGVGIVLRSVRAAVPKGFKVTILKPDAALRTERVRIAQVRDVFSGGQHLTAAIILYCTLAGLRANEQGRVHHRHSGVLFLDNPIGRASAGYLLDLQRGVAAALGVQLVYTTGLFDAEALGGFPLIIRLRNDADLRAGRKYLSVDARIEAILDELPDADGGGILTAARTLLPERHR
ncbi:hypothetical protein [Nocardia bhagyanarayanae]|uniref:Chromosome segregation ATPase n=1 Tax=Nocardia bhagyanarayanae TaxID=1215925 RepID=A0A543FFT4_9NOCA|nr:hypothetical protein [Nocardia bhagyanarayanae]TQM32717.1 hypothetical protein FB390_4413 [Nocardia bhagyanarayanae]